MPIAGSLSIERFEVSRNGTVQLWGLKGNLSGKTRQVSFGGQRKGIVEQHDRDKSERTVTHQG